MVVGLTQVTAQTKVLLIASVWPEPASSAAGARTLGLLRLLKDQGWRVICASAAAESELAFDLLTLGIEKQSIALNHPSFDHFIAALQPDLVIFDRFMTEEQFGWRVSEQCPQALRVLDTIDLHFLRLGRQKAFKESRPVTREDLQSDTAKREIAAILRCDLALILSEFEMDLLLKEFHLDAAVLHFHPLTVSTKRGNSVSNLPAWEERNGFVTMGNFRHEPNWDSVLYLKQTVWPAIRKRMPSAVLRVYGSYLTPKAQSLHAPKEGFLVLGRAENALEVMKDARVCLAPLRFGAGIKGKLLDAMQSGTPSVTTDIGAEGMHGEYPWGGVIAHDAESLADAAVRLHADREAWYQAQTLGLQLFKARYHTDAFDIPLLQRWAAIQANLNDHRSRNFIGAILGHHTLQSTKYLAKWIEAKNQNQ